MSQQRRERVYFLITYKVIILLKRNFARIYIDQFADFQFRRHWPICRPFSNFRFFYSNIWSTFTRIVSDEINTLRTCLLQEINFKFSKTRCRLGLRPRPRWGSLRRSPRPPSRISTRFARIFRARYRTFIRFTAPHPFLRW